jgi:large subunit ribosomal protein L10
MAKSRAQKEKSLTDLDQKLKSFKSLVFIDYKGLKVKEAAEIKRLCKKQNVSYLVAKKTLIKMALEKAGYKDIDVKALQGNIAMIIGLEDEVAPAKIIANYAKDHQAIKLLGGVMESKFIDLDQVTTLSKIPSKVELLSQLLRTINGPVSGFVNVLAANIRGLVTVLGAIKETKA